MNLHDYLLIPRLIEASLFFLIALLLNSKYQHISFRQRPLLHRLFLMGFCGWIVYVICDIFIYSFGTQSFTIGENIIASGFDFRYPSLLIVNILRDLAMIGIFFTKWCYFFVPFAIKNGELTTQKMFQNKWLRVFIIILSGAILTNDYIIVIVTSDTIIITENWNEMAMFSIFLYIAIYLIASLHLSFVFYQIKKTDQSKNTKSFQNRMIQLNLGIFLMGIAYLFWYVMNIIGRIMGLENDLFYFLSVSYILHTLFMLSPICIFLGLREDSK